MTEIKICGIKYDEDIGIINELKPDYAGMVLFFEKSKRNIAIDRAAEMIKSLIKIFKNCCCCFTRHKSD